MGRAAEPVGVGGFEIGYVTDDGLEHRVSLSEAWATPFESSARRRFTSHKGQRHLSGLWWSATTGGHVGFESWMERDHVMALDFDPTVVGIASQPFWLSWRDEAGKLISHAPDFFARQLPVESGLPQLRQVRALRRGSAVLAAQTRAMAQLAEGAPDDATADYLHRYFEPTARAIDGLERALAGLGLLDQALALDLRKPQDYFRRVWSTAFRATDLADRRRHKHRPRRQRTEACA